MTTLPAESHPGARQAQACVVKLAGSRFVNLARRLGITNYVTKPVDEGAFVRLVVSLTGRGAGLERTEARS